MKKLVRIDMRFDDDARPSSFVAKVGQEMREVEVESQCSRLSRPADRVSFSASSDSAQWNCKYSDRVGQNGRSLQGVGTVDPVMTCLLSLTSLRKDRK